MSTEAMAQSALAIVWGGAICGTGVLSFLFWLEVIAGREPDRKVGAAFLAFVSTAIFLASLFWTLSIADIFHLWERIGRRVSLLHA